MFVNENLDNFLKPKNVDDIIFDYLKRAGYDPHNKINDFFSIAITNRLYTDLILTDSIEIEKLDPDTGFDWNLTGTIKDLYLIFKKQGFKIKDIFNMIGL